MRAALECACVAVALSGCASYGGTARSVDPGTIAAEPGWLRVSDVVVVRQSHASDCGPAALSSVLEFWGLDAPRQRIEQRVKRLDAASPGTRAGALRDYARSRGLSAFVFLGTLADLQHEVSAGRPVIVGLEQRLTKERALRHYSVVVGLHPASRRVLTMDPAHGLREDSLDGFMGEWEGSSRLMLVVFPPA